MKRISYYTKIVSDFIFAPYLYLLISRYYLIKVFFQSVFRTAFLVDFLLSLPLLISMVWLILNAFSFSFSIFLYPAICAFIYFRIKPLIESFLGIKNPEFLSFAVIVPFVIIGDLLVYFLLYLYIMEFDLHRVFLGFPVVYTELAANIFLMLLILFFPLFVSIGFYIDFTHKLIVGDSTYGQIYDDSMKKLIVIDNLGGGYCQPVGVKIPLLSNIIAIASTFFIFLKLLYCVLR